MLFPKPPKRVKKRRLGVTPNLHAFVLNRDGACVPYLLGWPHDCQTRFGQSHSPYHLSMLTLEHVKDELGMSIRAEDDPQHLVACCGMLNDQVPSALLRELLRAYLERVERLGLNARYRP